MRTPSTSGKRVVGAAVTFLGVALLTACADATAPTASVAGTDDATAPSVVSRPPTPTVSATWTTVPPTATVPAVPPTSAPPATVDLPPPAPRHTVSPVRPHPEPQPCTDGQIQVTAEHAPGGLGHHGLLLRLTNTTTRACTLVGYPGIAALDGDGRQTQQARRSVTGFLGGLPAGSAPPVVTLGSGGTAVAVVETTTGEPSCNPPQGGDLPVAHALLVTPPNTTDTVRLAADLPDCAPWTVHPVVDPGSR